MYNILLYLTTIVVWGSSWLMIKFQIGDVPAIQSVFYRFLIAAVLLLIYLSLTKRLRWFNLKTHFLFIIIGGLLFSTNYVLIYLATEHGLTTGLIAVIFSLLITMNIANNFLFFQEKPKQSVLFGAGIGLLGIALLFHDEIILIFHGTGPSLGILLSALAAYSASLGNMTSRKLQSMQIEVTNSNAWGMLYGSIFLCIASLLTTPKFVFSFTLAYVISLIGLAIFASIIAFWAYLTLLGRIGSDRAAYATIAFPVVALILSSLFEDYTWTALKYIGIALIILGNLIAIDRLKPSNLPKFIKAK